MKTLENFLQNNFFKLELDNGIILPQVFTGDLGMIDIWLSNEITKFISFSEFESCTIDINLKQGIITISGDEDLREIFIKKVDFVEL